MKFLTTCLTAVLLTVPVLAQDPPDGPPGPRGFRGEALQNYLQLTDEQKESLKANRQALHETIRPLMEQIREKRQQLRTEMQSETPNSSTIGQLNVEIKELGEQIKAAHAASRTDAVALLDSNQQAKLAELQNALELQAAARQAVGANLLAPPEGGFGMGPFGHGPRGPRGGFAKGFRGGHRFGPGPAPDPN